MRWQCQNFYLYGLVEPATGDSFFWEFSHLDAVCFQDFLNLFSSAYPDSLNFIHMDNGSFHKSLALTWPDNVIPIFQPPHSPELNPIERLWEHIKQALSWQTCNNLNELRNNLKQVLDSLSTEAIASVCGWHYIVCALLSATSYRIGIIYLVLPGKHQIFTLPCVNTHSSLIQPVEASLLICCLVINDTIPVNPP